MSEATGIHFVLIMFSAFLTRNEEILGDPRVSEITAHLNFWINYSFLINVFELLIENSIHFDYSFTINYCNKLNVVHFISHTKMKQTKFCNSTNKSIVF